MKTKFNGILTLFLALVVQISFAQQKTISGTVADKSGPLPGVSILIKGTNTGTETDFDGKYSIKAKSGDILVFRYLGFKAMEKTVGDSNTINVKLEEDASVLDEIVVTALGIERNAKEIGYAVTTIKNEDLNEVRETNVLNALQGKTSGVSIKNQSGNLGGSQKILIRGNSSLSGTVQPLFVVDGVPISNSNISTGDRISGGLDFGNRAQDINPDDIESVTILKGASAAALYGSRASGGVILITTKRGKQGQKANITFSSTFRIDQAFRLPDFQREFAAGDDGVYDFTVGPGDQVTSGWGPSLSSLSNERYTNVAGDEVPFEALNNPSDFFSFGQTSVNSLSISGASETDDYRASVSYTEMEGIIPNAELNRLNLGFNAGKKFNDKLKSRFNINYVNTITLGTAAQGSNDPNVLSPIIFGQPITTDLTLFENFVNDAGEQINDPGGQSNNPYWITNKNTPEVENERLFGNASIQYNLTDNFDVLGRVGYDTYTEQRFLKNAVGTIGRLQGNFTDDLQRSQELTLDLLGTYSKEFSEDLNLTLRGGTQYNKRVFNRLLNTATNLTVPELYSPSNADNNVPIKQFSERRIFGVLGDVTLNYKNWLTLNVTGRNDWSSTLPKEANSFFYPSVNVSWIFTDALNIESDIISYGKLRSAWANVGGDTGPYLLDFIYTPDSAFWGQFSTDGTFPIGGQLAFNSSGALADPNLKPSNQTTFEVGLEMGLFRNRINFDLTYYDNLNENDIIFVPTAQTSGFSSYLTNVGGVSNKGVELQVNAFPIKTKDFTWEINYNFTKNTTTVENLDGIAGGALNLDTGFNSVAVRAFEGESFQLYGPRFKRAIDEDGNEIEDKILVDEDGIRQVGESGKLGKIDPDFMMGLTTSFKYKGWKLSTTFDYREGGLIYSNTAGLLRRAGLAEETSNREVFVDPNTFTQSADGAAVVPNTTEVSSVQDYWLGYASSSIVEGNVFDATFIKWRELSLSYQFSSEHLGGTFFSALQIGLQGRNLGLFNTSVPHIDPESSLGGSASQLDGIERGGLPTTSSYGFNIIAKF